MAASTVNAKCKLSRRTFLRGIGAITGRTEQIARLTGSLRVDIASIKTALGWRPPFTLQQGLAQTVSWYRARSG